MPAPLDLTPSAVKLRVDDRIRATLDATARALAPTGLAGEEMIAVLSAAATGGKRLRALLTVASHAAHDGSAEEAAISVAAALEWFQTAALIHDDVLDGSDTRRGQPAAHRRFEALLSEVAQSGQAEEMGRSAGVLAGDIALMASHRALSTALVSLADPAPVAGLFSSMAELVTAGQYLDMRLAATPLDALPEQRESIMATMRSKTASYSAEAPLALGAAVAGADAATIARMQDIGVPLGIAFQLRDDVLGLIGAPEVTGKPAGDDVREGKRTMLLWHAWTHGDASQRAVLASAVGKRGASQAEIDEAVTVVVDAGGVRAAESQIDELVGPAMDSLATLGLSEPGADVLTDLATRLTARVA